jgi:hypothetical protein
VGGLVAKDRKKNRPFFFTVLSILFVGTLTSVIGIENAFAIKRPDAAGPILAAFQGSCGSQGAFTQAAQTQINNLVNILQGLKSTDACKPFATQLGSVQLALSQIQSVQQNPSFAAYQTDIFNSHLLTLALANAPEGSVQRQSLSSGLLAAQLQTYSDQAAYNVATKTAQRNLIVSQSSSLLGWGQQLTSATSSSGLEQCLLQSKGASIEIGANLAALGGSFIPGVYGAGATAIAQLLNSGIEIFRAGKYDRKIFQAQSVQMPDAISCALESMTESYCGANDSFTLLDLARSNRLKNYAATPLWRGIDIQSRQLPSLLNWLGQIENEVPPQDSYQASRQGAVLNEILQVQQQNLNTVAAINVAFSQAQLSTTQDAKLSTIVNMIATQALQLASPQGVISGGTFNNTPTPFSNYQPSAYVWACWFVLGPNTAAGNCPKPSPQDIAFTGIPNPSQLSDYITVTLGLTSAALPSLQAGLPLTWQALLPRVQVLVNADFARVLATNAGTILASARVKSGGAPISPFRVLKSISNFLSNIPVNDNPQLSVVLELEKKRISETLRQLEAPDSVVCPPFQDSPGNPKTIQLTPEQCLNSRLIVIFNLFELKNGTQVFLTDINNLVNIDLQIRLANGGIPQDSLKILQASGRDISVELASAGVNDLDPIADDLSNARADIEGNIRVFRDFFVDGFDDVVKHESLLTGGEGPELRANRPHGQRLGELCMLWLLTSNIATSKKQTYSNWPNPQVQSICEKTIYFNENDSPDSPTHNVPAFAIGKMVQKLGALPFRERVCAFHNYKLTNRAKTLYVEDNSL